jgi:hypothetical protein
VEVTSTSHKAATENAQRSRTSKLGCGGSSGQPNHGLTRQSTRTCCPTMHPAFTHHCQLTTSLTRLLRSGLLVPLVDQAADLLTDSCVLFRLLAVLELKAPCVGAVTW